MQKTELNVAVVQTQSVDDLAANQQHLLSLLNSIPSDRSLDLICFPENALYLRVISGEEIPALDLHDPIFLPFKEWAKRRNCALHFGSVPLKQAQKTGNSGVWITTAGEVEEGYTKIHLFDIHLEGQEPIRESDRFAHGSKPEVYSLGSWKLGQSICYDVRFSELYHQYSKQKADALLVPAAFLVQTGKAHWEILLRARAIESQCYVLAAAQAGVHKSVRSGQSRSTYGNSMIIGPWGDVLVQASPDQPEVIYATLGRVEIEKVRRQIPMASHRRL